MLYSLLSKPVYTPMNPPQSKISFVEYIFFFFSGWGVLATVLAWTGFFFYPFFIAYTILFLGYSIFRSKLYSVQYTLSLLRMPEVYSRLLLFLFCLALAAFLQPATLFSGRDEGSIFQAAAMLASQHTLTFSSPESQTFFAIYQEGKALNFPGFYYTQDGSLTTQFPVPYIAWLASFFTPFGILGILPANGILLFLFFLACTNIIQTFAPKEKRGKETWRVFGILLIAFSFPVIWFSRFTLSENFLLGFLWVFIWTAFSFAQKPSISRAVLFFLSGILVLFGRIEGIAFFMLGLLFILFHKQSRSFLLFRKEIFLFLPFCVLLLFGTLSLLANTPFYITVAKGFLNGSQEAFNNAPSLISSFLERFRILFLYGIGVPCVLGVLGMIALLTQKKEKNALIAAVWITFPAFFYVFFPFISSDHPWMLRRFLFAFTPIILLLSLFLCAILQKTRFSLIGKSLIGILLSSNAAALGYFFLPQTEESENAPKRSSFYAEAFSSPFTSSLRYGGDLLATTKTIADAIPNDELVLVDQLSSGSGFHMISGPLQTLFGKHAVYFMNPNDIENIDARNFSSFSLLVPEGRENIYTPLLKKYNAQKVRTFPVSFATLETLPVSSPRFPRMVVLEQEVFLYRWTPS